jgi:hypothetical protein
MKRLTCINLFGGTVAGTARRLGITTQAVNKWEDWDDGKVVSMPLAVCDRGLAAWIRLAVVKYPELRSLLRTLGLPPDALRAPAIEEEETI